MSANKLLFFSPLFGLIATRLVLISPFPKNETVKFLSTIKT